MVFSSSLTALPGERVYALMGFMQRRIIPDPSETEGQAFDRLMRANGLECSCYPWDALKSGDKFVAHDIISDAPKNRALASEHSNSDGTFRFTPCFSV